MNILLNNLVTLSADPAGGSFVITGVTGLGSADIRTSSFLYSGRSGGLVTDQFYGFRNISITGKIGAPGNTRVQHALDRQTLLSSMPIGVTFPVYITTFDGLTYRVDCSRTDAKVEYTQGGYMSDFLIQLTAGDPLFYSTAGGDVQSAVVNKTQNNGGYVTPYVLPVIWSVGGAPTVVTNSGTAIVYPVITIHDTAHNPILTNSATGEQFALNINTNDGDQLVIDMFNRTAKLNGSDVIGNVAAGSTWWGLMVGANSVYFDTSTIGDDAYSVINWRNGVTGI